MKEYEFLQTDKRWVLSSYNEGTKEELDYYLCETKCEVGDKAYLYSHEDGKITEMEIVHIISCSNDKEKYTKLLEDDDVLIDGEDEYNADTSAEFITDDDCYLVWFKYVSFVGNED